MGGGACPFLVGGVTCLVDSVTNKACTCSVVAPNAFMWANTYKDRPVMQEVRGIRRSVMPFDVLGCARAALVWSGWYSLLEKVWQSCEKQTWRDLHCNFSSWRGDLIFIVKFSSYWLHPSPFYMPHVAPSWCINNYFLSRNVFNNISLQGGHLEQFLWKCDMIIAWEGPLSHLSACLNEIQFAAGSGSKDPGSGILLCLRVLRKCHVRLVRCVFMGSEVEAQNYLRECQAYLRIMRCSIGAHAFG